MRFRPRHYVLIAIILVLGVYNFMRMHRASQRVAAPTTVAVSNGPVPQSPAWQAFDKAAGLRDAADDQFQPALSALKQQIDTASEKEKADLDGCQTWLLFYRQNAHASARDAWRERSTQHLDNCARYHRDLSS
ncbi:MAG TPA: hypothetical protein VGU25_17820 [Acidobacteriaceae bacterium]|nr:hypothetical protein [Acidobacteriaceae bacterium]